jgi:hypothetical protein
MSYNALEITFLDGSEIQTKGNTRIWDGVLVVTPPDRYAPLEHYPLTSIKSWTSRVV